MTPLDFRSSSSRPRCAATIAERCRPSCSRSPTITRTRCADNDKLRQGVAKLDAVLGEHRGQERNLRNSLRTAQKMGDEIKEHAQANVAPKTDAQVG